jgi:NAD(P)-dependent dehydrogenase (short-subunit alcohol dehydrogenase family)
VRGAAVRGRGCTVIIAGRRHAEGQRLAGELGSGAEFVATDISVEAEVQALIAHVVDRYGRLDCLVNNAGAGGTPGGVATIDMDRFWHTLTVDLGGVVLGMNIASIGGRLGGWSLLDYSPAKAAVLQLTRCVAVEVGEHGVRVNSVSPGPLLTGLFGKAAGMDAAQADHGASVLVPVFVTRLASWQPIRRAGVPDDVAPVLVWLASDAAAFVNGQDLAVDGGISSGRPASVSAADRAAMAQVLRPQS